MSELNRRQFISLAVIAAATCATCGPDAEAQTTTEAPAKGPPPNVGTVNVGKPAKYAKDGAYDEFAKSKRVMVVRSEGKIYAPTATCTHKNAALKVKDGQIVCPNHGSKFSLKGTSTKGPAKGSLYRYAISVDASGDIIVNKEKQFAEKDWESDGAFIKA